MDATTSIKHLGVIACLALTPKPVLLFSNETGAESKNEDYYVANYLKAILMVGEGKVVATINDNEKAITNAQDTLELDPETRSLIHLRCFSHVLNLLAERVFSTNSSSKLLEVVTTTSKKIRKSNILNGHFNDLTKDLNIDVSMVLPGTFRTAHSFRSVFLSEVIIYPAEINFYSQVKLDGSEHISW